MVLKPQDIVVALKLCADDTRRSYADLSTELGLSASEVHAAVRRLTEARLIDLGAKTVEREALQEFLVHGVPYAFPVRPMETVRGIPTASAASILSGRLGAAGELPPVWPDSEGGVIGSCVTPLYPTVPRAARRDPALYALLALVDALRLGNRRARSLAEGELGSRLQGASSG